MNSKTRSIVAYITIIGWLIAYFTRNKDENNEAVNFHLKQSLGACLIGLIPFIGFIGLVFMIIGAINANNEKMKELPILGEHFNDWFKSI